MRWLLSLLFLLLFALATIAAPSVTVTGIQRSGSNVTFQVNVRNVPDVPCPACPPCPSNLPPQTTTTTSTIAPTVTVPAAPSNLYVGKLTSGLRITWKDNSSNEASMVLDRGQSYTGPWTSITLPANTTNYTDTAVAAGGFYAYRARAVNSAGSSAPSNVGGDTAPAAPVGLSAPYNLNASPVSSTAIALTWADTNATAVTFDVEHAPTSTGPWAFIGSAPSTAFTDTGLEPAATWFYRVKAVN